PYRHTDVHPRREFHSVGRFRIGDHRLVGWRARVHGISPQFRLRDGVHHHRWCCHQRTRAPRRGGGPVGITSGPDGAIWFTEADTTTLPPIASKIGRMSTTGQASEFPLAAATTSLDYSSEWRQAA